MEVKNKPKKQAIKGVGLKGGERVVAVEAGPIIETQTDKKDKELLKKSRRKKVRSKKWQAAKAKIDAQKFYPIDKAISLIKETSYSNFDGTMELHLVTKKEGLSVQVTLPHSTGTNKKVEVTDEATLEKLKNGKIDLAYFRVEF